MKVLICGSRGINDYTLLRNAVNGSEFIITSLIAGGARGVDRMAELFASDQGLPIEIVRPDWDTYGKAAGMIRNKQMVTMADAVIAIWDGESKGTLNSIKTARKMGKPVYVITTDKVIIPPPAGWFTLVQEKL